jgi:hypothetical protein
MSNIKILVATHKNAQFPKDDIFLPIHVGKALSDIDLHIQGDDKGENISAKNRGYAELTAMYWAWKNLENLEYIGLCHYRRYFNFHNRGLFFSDSQIISAKQFSEIHLKFPDPKILFEKFDVIIAKPILYRYSIFIDYCVGNYSEYLKTTLDIVSEKNPDYKKSIYEVFHRSNRLSPYNMMIMKWDDYSDYCQWLFDILNEAEKRINTSYYNDTQSRIWGYLAERLFNLYIHHNKLIKKEIPIYKIDDTMKDPSLILRTARTVRNKLSFFIGKAGPKKNLKN